MAFGCLPLSLLSLSLFIFAQKNPLLKILIIRFSSIGDIVLTSPVIRCLKLQKEAEIHYLTKKSFASILNVNPYISKVHTIEKSLRPILPTLRQEKFDCIIDLHHNLRSFWVKGSMPFTKSYAFKKLNFEKWLLVNFKINRLPKQHIVDRYLATVRPLGVENDGQGLDFFLPETDSQNFQNLARLKNRFPNYIALPIGAGKNTKALTIGKIVAVIQQVNYPIVLLGGPQEREKAAQIENALLKNPTNNSPKSPTFLNLVGQCTLLESAAIVKNAKVVVTGDTGLMHIAAAFHRPIVSIWGNTIPEFGMTPYYPKGLDLNRIVEVKDLSCRPCSKIGFDKCPKGHFGCVERIATNKIVEEALSFRKE